MDMKKFLLLPALFCSTLLLAQYQDYSTMGKTPSELQFIDDPLKIELKEPSWFWHNPKKDTAEEQLIYALSLEREGDWEDAIASLRAIGDKMKLPFHLTFHVARHTFAVFALRQNPNIYAVSKYLGHTSTRSTERTYAEFLPEDYRKTFLEKIDFGMAI